MKQCIYHSTHFWSGPCQSHTWSRTHSHSELRSNIIPAQLRPNTV